MNVWKDLEHFKVWQQCARQNGNGRNAYKGFQKAKQVCCYCHVQERMLWKFSNDFTMAVEFCRPYLFTLSLANIQTLNSEPK